MRPARNALIFFCFLSLISVSASQFCFASTYIFTPENHSVYMDQRDPDLNWVSKSGLLVASELNENSRSVLRFDLEGWIPHPDSILQAKLYLYHYRGGYYTGSRTVSIYPLTTAFHESTVTWNTPWTIPGGDYDSTISASADVPEAWNNWVFWDVTEILRNRWNHITDNGFLLKDPVEDYSGSGPYIRFYSHRCLNDADTLNDFPAYLEVQTNSRSGDVNRDGAVDVGDVVFLINYLFKQGPAPIPYQSGDINQDEAVEVGDVVYLINYLYKGGSSPLR